MDVAERDIAWLTPDGRLMTEEDWSMEFGKSLMVHLNGQAIAEPDVHGRKVEDDSFLLCFNAHHEPITFTLPLRHNVMHVEPAEEQAWTIVIDTSEETGGRPELTTLQPGDELEVAARSVVVLQRPLTDPLLPEGAGTH